MQKAKQFFIISGISGIIAVISLAIGIYASFNLPSGVSRQQFGDGIIPTLASVGPIISIIFAIVAITFLVVGLIVRKKKSTLKYENAKEG